MPQLPALPENLSPAFSHNGHISVEQRQFRDAEPPRAFPQPFRILRRHWPVMLALVLGSGAAAYWISARMTPMYESTATIDIDPRMPSGILGQAPAQYPSGDSDQFLATQVSLIQSDAVLRPVVERFH